MQKTCPKCKEINPGSKLLCEKCGTSLVGVEVEVTDTELLQTKLENSEKAKQQVVAQVEEKIKLENAFSYGYKNFYWIAGLSLINSVVFLFGGAWRFLMGLGSTLIVDVIAVAIMEEVGGESATTIIRIIAFGIDFFIASLFIGIGILAGRKHKWAFVVGMILYGIDTLVFLIELDIINIAFHVYFLFGINVGFTALRKLLATEKEKTGLLGA